MKIVHIIWGLTTGGAETMLVDIVNEQVKRESVAIVVINDLINQALFEKIDKRCFVKLCRRTVGSKSFCPWVNLNVFLWRYHPDIIHFHLEGMRKMVFHPAPQVFTIHNMHTSGIEYPKYKALYAISDAVKRRTKEQGFESTTIWNGIHPSQIVVKKDFDVIRPSYRFVCVGRLYTPHKGQDILIHALEILKKKGLYNYHLDIIGDGESRGQLEMLIKSLGLNDFVTLLGHRDREYVYSHLSDYDLFILPSRSEGFGLAVAEAMCAKVPVLVCDLEGPKEVIQEGKYGLFYRSEDVKDLALKLQNVIEYGISVAIDEASAFAMENFCIEVTAQKYLEEYHKVIEHL